MSDSKVVRLSNDTIDMLEEYRNIQIKMYESYYNFKPNDSLCREIDRWKSMSYPALLNHVVSSGLYWLKNHVEEE